MARTFDPYRLTGPRVFLLIMVIFLTITGFLASILHKQIFEAFATNPGLNGLILSVLAVGIMLALLQVIRLMPEVTWVNSFREGNLEQEGAREPVMLAPMKELLGQSGQNMSLTTGSMRSILESIGTRLDEARDISRYLIGLLVFLGLLGTFWGLLGTIGSIGDTIQSLDPGSGSTSDILDALKSGLSAPLDGMGTAFSSSLFGLSGSLILGFMDLQAGRAQNRFYTELENWLSTVTDMNSELMLASGAVGDTADDIRNHLEQLTQNMQQGGGNTRVTAAMVSLAERNQELMRLMRADRQDMKTYLEQQATQQEQFNTLLAKLDRFFERVVKE